MLITISGIPVESGVTGNDCILSERQGELVEPRLSSKGDIRIGFFDILRVKREISTTACAHLKI